MADDEKPTIVTEDSAIKAGRLSTADHRALFEGPYIELKPDELKELGRAALATFNTLSESVSRNMTPERAAEIKWRRCVYGGSWRLVAELTYAEWGADADWYPASNQIAGIVLCAKAAKMLGEDPTAKPWD